MLPIEPDLENHSDDRTTENDISLSEAYTSTSPKTKELRERYKADHPIEKKLKPHKSLLTNE